MFLQSQYLLIFLGVEHDTQDLRESFATMLIKLFQCSAFWNGSNTPYYGIWLLPFPHSFVAMFNYKPQNADEIELKKGEVYTVSEKCKDGWFKGMSIVSGQIGVFPGNYMQVFRSVAISIIYV